MHNLTDVQTILEMVMVVCGAKEAAAKAHGEATERYALVEETRLRTERAYSHTFAKSVDESEADVAKAAFERCTAAAEEARTQAQIASAAYEAVLSASDSGDLYSVCEEEEASSSGGPEGDQRRDVELQRVDLVHAPLEAEAAPHATTDAMSTLDRR